MRQIKVGILIFNEVEVLDFAGPFEVFSVATDPRTSGRPFNVVTVAQSKKTITARNGLKVVPHFSFEDYPEFDILIVPGGYGAEEIEIHNRDLIKWLKGQSTKVKLMASVCTGAFLLAKAGLLDGKSATTHWMDIEKLEIQYPEVKVQRNVKFVDEGNIITAGGISAGINMSLHIVKRAAGDVVARYTAKKMEYDIEV